METRKPKARRGRPKGAKNLKRPTVIDIPPGCPRAGYESTEYVVLRLAAERPLQGIRDGRPYNHVTWRRGRCLACSQHYVLITYEFRPAVGPLTSSQENRKP
jgi:hypothetical protein